MKVIGQLGRLFGEWMILLALSILGVFYLQFSGVTERIDNQLLDTASSMVRPVNSDDIVLVAIDDKSLREIGGWPWRRSTHARLLDALSDAGARAIVFDVLFVENSDLQEDAALEGALARAGNVVLPHTFSTRPNTDAGVDPLYPLPAFVDATAGIGHVEAAPDPDGILRRFDLMFTTDRGDFPHLAVTAMDFLGHDSDRYRTDQNTLIPFHPEESVNTYSASTVLNGQALPEILEDKIVFIGATAQGMGDRYAVASGQIGLMSGVEVQANLLNALISDAVITPADRIWLIILTILALFMLFGAFWYVSPKIGLYVALALAFGVVAISLSLMAFAHIWLPVASIIIMIILAYPLWSWRRLSHVSRYLDREAARMIGGEAVLDHKGTTDNQGMEYVARQVNRVRGLIHSIEGSLTFVRQVIEAAPDAMIVVDDRGHVQMLNAKADQLFPEWETQSSLSLDALFQFGRAHLQRDGGELLTEDGRIFLIAKAALGPLAPNNEPMSGEIMALREITDLRRLDQERKQMLEFLSHDMRTPQVAIIGLTRKPEKVADATDALDTMARIKKQAERTLKLADDFVQLARLESPELQLEDSDIGALIEEACDRAYVLAETKHIAIKQELPTEPCFADVDASLIARMLDNLIGNAVKYSPEHSRITVKLGVTERGTHQIFVSDEGAGLPEARVKDPFARFGAHATHAGPSAGLGLALVKKVVDAHSGTIEVTSQPNKGTQFAISLAT
ncbi:MAG: CHASE2 domain-containing protein [Erythrobacter sp.]